MGLLAVVMVGVAMIKLVIIMFVVGVMITENAVVCSRKGAVLKKKTGVKT